MNRFVVIIGEKFTFAHAAMTLNDAFRYSIRLFSLQCRFSYGRVSSSAFALLLRSLVYPFGYELVVLVLPCFHDPRFGVVREVF